MPEDLDRKQHLKYVYVFVRLFHFVVGHRQHLCMFPFDSSILLWGIDNTGLMDDAFRKEKWF